jgi:hypothetical protein
VREAIGIRHYIENRETDAIARASIAQYLAETAADLAKLEAEAASDNVA